MQKTSGSPAQLEAVCGLKPGSSYGVLEVEAIIRVVHPADELERTNAAETTRQSCTQVSPASSLQYLFMSRLSQKCLCFMVFYGIAGSCISFITLPSFSTLLRAFTIAHKIFLNSLMCHIRCTKSSFKPELSSTTARVIFSTTDRFLSELSHPFFLLLISVDSNNSLLPFVRSERFCCPGCY